MVTRKDIVEFLEDLGVLQETDMALINELMYNISIMRKAKKEIKDEGITVKINAGKTLVANPAINIYSTYLKQYLSICRAVGLSPQARKEMGLDNIEQSDGF